MTHTRRLVQSMQFERHGHQMVLVLTTNVGAEIVVEQIPLGCSKSTDVAAILEAALESLKREVTAPAA